MGENLLTTLRCITGAITQTQPHPRFLHDHGFLEFFWCAGGGGVQVTPGKTYLTAPGDLFLFPQGVPHYCHTTVEDGRCDYLVLFAGSGLLTPKTNGLAQIVETLVKAARKHNHRIPVSAQGSQQIGKLMTQMLQECHRNRRGAHEALLILYQQMLLELLRDDETGGLFDPSFAASPARDRLSTVLHYLQVHFAEPVSVEELAKMACLSRSHFHAMFREETGVPVLDYVNRLRVEAASDLLRQSDLPILEIASACGYPSLSHFYHIFNRLAGMTPREVRFGTPPPSSMHCC